VQPGMLLTAPRAHTTHDGRGGGKWQCCEAVCGAEAHGKPWACFVAALTGQKEAMGWISSAIEVHIVQGGPIGGGAVGA